MKHHTCSLPLLSAFGAATRRTFRTSALLLLSGVGLIATAQTTTVTNTTYASGQNVTVNGPTSVATSGTVTVSSGSIIKFRGTSAITLSPGFTATAGSTFRAFIFIDTDGDGMDDGWEIANGFDPNNPADGAADADGDGMSNLAEYLMGTNPRVYNSGDTGNTNNLKVHRPQQ